MLNTPLVSIIVPAFNAALYIGDTIRSVQEQTFTDWELWLIDDGSTDNTAEIITPFLIDTRIHYYRQTNSGVSAARNTGIEKATGQFIGFLDADDAFTPESLSVKITALEQFPEIIFVYGDVVYCDEKLLPGKVLLKGDDTALLKNLLRWESTPLPLSCGNVLARRVVFDKGFRFDTKLSTAADQDFSFYMAHHYKGRHLDLVSTKYRVLPGSMSRNIAVMEKDHLRVYQKAAENGLFTDNAFRRACFGRLYLTLAGSWWVNGNNKLRAIRFMIRAVFTWPGAFKVLIKKMTTR